MKKALKDLSGQELLAQYNAIPGVRPIARWAGKKSELIGRIARARRAAPRPAPKPPAAEAPARSRTVRAASLEMLCAVTHYEDKNRPVGPENVFAEPSPDRRSVGLPYDDILRSIATEFPGAQTSVACLRWYAVKVRVEEAGYEGLRLPQRRPRVKPTR
jgi:hypothetical protein